MKYRYNRNKGNILEQTIHETGNILEKTVDTAGNVVEKTVDAAGNVVEKTLDTAGNILEHTVNGISKLFEGSPMSVKDRQKEVEKKEKTNKNTPVPANTGSDIFSYYGAIPSKSGNFIPITADFSKFRK
jgi:YD repeat-containing protein